jgi:hypothetical protein
VKREFVVRVRFQPMARTLTRSRVVGLAKLDSDEPGHPSGQRSVIADRAWLDFAAPDAPRSGILQDHTFPLYVGPNLIAEIDVLLARHRELATYDNDFLADRHARARSTAAA